jgi:hypothetical protein
VSTSSFFLAHNAPAWVHHVAPLLLLAVTATQIGTVQSDALDPPSSRLPAGQRGASLTQQLLADADITTNRKKRYNKLQV